MKLLKELIKRNEKDINEVSRLVTKLDKISSKELAGAIERVLINEVLRLSKQTKELKKFLEMYKTNTNQQKNDKERM